MEMQPGSTELFWEQELEGDPGQNAMHSLFS